MIMIAAIAVIPITAPAGEAITTTMAAATAVIQATAPADEAMATTMAAVTAATQGAVIIVPALTSIRAVMAANTLVTVMGRVVGTVISARSIVSSTIIAAMIRWAGCL